MKGRGCLASGLALPVLLVVAWLLQEASFRLTLRRYSREFKPGMTRKKVEDRLVIIQPDYHRLIPPVTDYVALGHVTTFSFACSFAQVIALDFQMRDPHTLDDNDTLTKVELRQILEGCL